MRTIYTQKASLSTWVTGHRFLIFEWIGWRTKRVTKYLSNTWAALRSTTSEIFARRPQSSPIHNPWELHSSRRHVRDEKWSPPATVTNSGDFHMIRNLHRSEAKEARTRNRLQWVMLLVRIMIDSYTENAHFTRKTALCGRRFLPRTLDFWPSTSSSWSKSNAIS